MKKQKCKGCDGRDKMIQALAGHIDRLEKELRLQEKRKSNIFLIKKHQNGIDLVL